MTIAGRTVLITGGGAGMGQAMARRFHGEGAAVALLEIDPARLRDTVESLGGERVLGIEGDVADPDTCERAVAEAATAFGRVDVVCNNAGILGEGLLADMSIDTWRRVIDVDLSGVFFMCRAAIPRMLDQRRGVFVNTASSSAFVGGGGDAAYTAAKHGVVGLTRAIAVEYAKQGIRANALCPGPTATPMTQPYRGPEGGPYDEFIASIPAGRWAQPDEMARLALYLASDDADFVHGAAWCIDGGLDGVLMAAPDAARRADFTVAVDRGRLAGSVVAPAGDAGGATLVCVPGMTYRRSYWDMRIEGHEGYSFAVHMAARGHVVVMLDNLGTGDSTPPADGGELDLGGLGVAVAQASDVVRERLRDGTLAPGLAARPPGRLVGIGHSLGGGVVVAAQAQRAPWAAIAPLGYTTQELAGIYEPAPAEERLSFAERRAWARAHIPQKLWGRSWDELEPFFAIEREGFAALFYGPEVPAAVIAADMAAATVSPRQAALDVITPQLGARFARDVRVPVLLAYGDTDLAPDPRAEVRAYGSSRDITLILLEATAHCHNVAGSRAALWDRLGAWIGALP